jgi:hypothetical protein
MVSKLVSIKYVFMYVCKYMYVSMVVWYVSKLVCKYISMCVSK